MPIYEYRCGACGLQKEFLQRISDAKLTDCPECGKSALSKMVTAAGFQLKGSGWYATDFKNQGVAKPKSDNAKPADASKPADAAKTADAPKTDAPKKDETKAAATSGAGVGST